MCIHRSLTPHPRRRFGRGDRARPSPVLYELRDSGVAAADPQPARADERVGRRAGRRVLLAASTAPKRIPTCASSSLTGSGRAFCAGADMGDACHRSSSAQTPTATPTSPSWSANVIRTSSPTLRKPIIAAINGACAGIGLTQALMCDVRFAAAGAKFTTVVRAARADRRVRHLAGSCRASSAGAPRWICC